MVAKSGNRSVHGCDSGKRASDAHSTTPVPAAAAPAGKGPVKKQPVLTKRLSGA